MKEHAPLTLHSSSFIENIRWVWNSLIEIDEHFSLKILSKHRRNLLLFRFFSSCFLFKKWDQMDFVFDCQNTLVCLLYNVDLRRAQFHSKRNIYLLLIPVNNVIFPCIYHIVWLVIYRAESVQNRVSLIFMENLLDIT